MQKQAPWLFGSPSSQVVLVNVCKYFLCMVENANYPSNSRVVVLFVQVVIICGINFGNYLTLLCNEGKFENYTKGLDSSIKRTWSLVHYTKAMIPTWTLHKS